jgi:hypothetical protein
MEASNNLPSEKTPPSLLPEEGVPASPVAAEAPVAQAEAQALEASDPLTETDAAPDGATEVTPVDYARQAAEDLAEIKRLDPAYAPAAHLAELPFAKRFAQLRDLGLSVAEALAAARPRFARTDGRAHLTPLAPRGVGTPGGTLDRERMKEARMLFGDLSDAEINALYRRVSQSND